MTVAIVKHGNRYSLDTVSPYGNSYQYVSQESYWYDTPEDAQEAFKNFGWRTELLEGAYGLHKNPHRHTELILYRLREHFQ